MKLVVGKMRHRFDDGKLSWSIGADYLPRSLHFMFLFWYVGVEW